MPQKLSPKYKSEQDRRSFERGMAWAIGGFLGLYALFVVVIFALALAFAARAGSGPPFDKIFLGITFGTIFFLALFSISPFAWLLWRTHVAVEDFRLKRLPASKLRPASLLQRAWARMIDVSILSLPLFLLGLGTLGWLFATGFINDLLQGRGQEVLRSILGVQLILGLLGALCALFYVGGFIAFAYFEGSTGQTPGKRWMGIQTLGLDLKPPGFWRALGRQLLILVDSQVGYAVGILCIALSTKFQRLGDMICETIVVKAE